MMTTRDTVELLFQHALFRGLAPELLRDVAALGEPLSVGAGEVLFRQGDIGDALYVVLSGSIRINVTTPEIANLEVATMEAGDVFGEISLLDGLPRTADAVVLKSCDLMRIPHERFVALMDRRPELSRHLLGLLCARVRSSNESLAIRKRAEQEMQAAKETAERALAELRLTQDNLIEAEKLAALGGLVAGVAHEINTPVGTALTTASHLADETQALKARFQSGGLRRSDLAAHTDMATVLCELLLSNLNRAATLIHSFQQVAADQTNDVRRRFDLADYLGELATSLGPQLCRAGHQLQVVCPPDLEIDGFPGALSQIITHLVNNGWQHAFPPETHGCITLAVTAEASSAPGAMITLRIADNGRGIAEEQQPHIFEPFFTTCRGAGHPGLGLHIAYNLAASTLRGRLALESSGAEGSVFVLRFPRIVAERDAQTASPLKLSRSGRPEGRGRVKEEDHGSGAVVGCAGS